MGTPRALEGHWEGRRGALGGHWEGTGGHWGSSPSRGTHGCYPRALWVQGGGGQLSRSWRCNVCQNTVKILSKLAQNIKDKVSVPVPVPAPGVPVSADPTRGDPMQGVPRQGDVPT